MGTALGETVVLNDASVNARVSLAAAATGEMVLAVSGLVGRVLRFDSNGQLIGNAEQLAGGSTTGVDVSMFTDGRHAVTWMAPSEVVFAQVYSATGNKLGRVF